MFRIFTLMLYVLCFIGIPSIINAETVNPVREHSSLTPKDGSIEPSSLRNDLYHRQESVALSNGAKTNFAAVSENISHNLSLPGDCPSGAILEKNKEWVEHREAWNKGLASVLAAHLKLPLAPVKGVYMNHVAVYVNRGTGVFPWQEIVWSLSRTNQANYSGKNNNCYVVGTVAYYVELKNKDGWPPAVEILNKHEKEKEFLLKGDLGLIELRWYDPVEKKKHRWFNHRLALYLQWVMENNYSPILLPRVINSLD